MVYKCSVFREKLYFFKLFISTLCSRVLKIVPYFWVLKSLDFSNLETLPTAQPLTLISPCHQCR